MSYAESGSGDAVVVLAGGPGLSSGYLTGLVEMLDDNHRVIVFDQRGTGGSRPAAINAETLSIELMIQDIEALRRHLELPRWTVLGHSFGTFMAMRYAAEHPAAVERLVLLSSVSPTDYFIEFSAALEARSSPEATQRMEQIRAAIAAAETEAQRGELMGQLQFELLPAYFADPAKLADLLADGGPAGSQADVFLQIRREIEGYDIAEQLKEIQMPTLIVQGAADPMMPSSAVPAPCLKPSSNGRSSRAPSSRSSACRRDLRVPCRAAQGARQRGRNDPTAPVGRVQRFPEARHRERRLAAAAPQRRRGGELTPEQLERKEAIFGILVALFERAYILVYDEKMDKQQQRLWQSWEDYMREWCRRRDFREALRLAALVPKPRAHLTRYHGVFAPASPDRARVVPKARVAAANRTSECGEAAPADRQRCLTWAQRLKRVFALDPPSLARRQLASVVSLLT